MMTTTERDETRELIRRVAERVDADHHYRDGPSLVTRLATEVTDDLEAQGFRLVRETGPTCNRCGRSAGV